jgi:transcriptional regulator with XRE-family HTH domain
MAESFGARLRKQREQQDIALATIAEQTKIKASLLEELERDNVSHWPTGIFRRAFIRAYAHAVGLDQDVVVREFLELYPDPVEVVETVSNVPPGGDLAAAGAGPPMRLRYLVGSAIGSLSRLRRGAGQKPSAFPEDPPVPDVAGDPPGPDAGGEPTAAAPPAPPVFEPDLLAVASVCTEFGRLDEPGHALPLLQEVTAILDAVGLIVWVWDSKTSELKAALAHGYSERVLAQVPRVRREADNATAAAFRTAQTCVVRGSDRASGALAVPLMTPAGCAGVLAIELKDGSEQRPPVRALATIFAAQLARVVDAARPVEAADRKLA